MWERYQAAGQTEGNTQAQSQHACSGPDLPEEGKGSPPPQQPSLHGSPLHNYVETLLATILFGCSYSNPWQVAHILLQPSRGGNRLQVANSLSVYNIHAVVHAAGPPKVLHVTTCLVCVCVCVCVGARARARQEENFGDLLMLKVQIVCTWSLSCV